MGTAHGPGPRPGRRAPRQRSAALHHPCSCTRRSLARSTCSSRKRRTSRSRVRSDREACTGRVAVRDARGDRCAVARCDHQLPRQRGSCGTDTGSTKSVQVAVSDGMLSFRCVTSRAARRQPLQPAMCRAQGCARKSHSRHEQRRHLDVGRGEFPIQSLNPWIGLTAPLRSRRTAVRC